MSSSLSLHDVTAAPAEWRKTLVAHTTTVASLDARTRDAAFALFAHAYENVSRERFERDLAGKQHVILLRDGESGALRGFSTVCVRDVVTTGGTMTVVFSGDTVIDRAYWGQKQLQLAFARLMVSLKLRAPLRPLSWFLLSKGYRTYLLLANAFPHSVPRAGVPDDVRLRGVLDDLATERFGAQYDRTAGVVRYDDPHERVREGLAPVTAAVLANPHVRFFVKRNPEHAAGVELACLADVRLVDLARAILRFVTVGALRRLRDPRSVGR
jgi:uncharacterized membrane protein